ncbi:MAG TPA: aminotransferase class V-fold PLP-dependent enzyme [Methylomirabilota bacterium]|nr:aminotransferase class V-fold PLP-dependent enzyme [Methylomirabilota bacterium]
MAPAVAVGLAALRPDRARAIALQLGAEAGSAEEAAADEALWQLVREAFAIDPGIVNLNNGGVSPAPEGVLASQLRRLTAANRAPAHTLWRVQGPERERVRRQVAEAFGCDAEELALTRNTTEGMVTVQLGLELEPGAEVLTTSQDYHRMIAAFRQRERREGVVMRQVALPPADAGEGAVVRAFDEAITPRTRLILMCHVINLNGRILPVADVVRAARQRGVPVAVDGAHAFANIPFSHADLGCDVYAASLHKWLCAPVGTGLLYVRRELIPRIWPLLGAREELDSDIRKFEEIGTHPEAAVLAIPEALAFHDAIGARRKHARLLHLRNRWARRLAEHPRVRLLTDLRPGAAIGLATFAADGIDPREMVAELWQRHRILVAAIAHPEVRGVRVSPSVYTTVDELDRFCAAVEELLDRAG